MDSSPGSRLGVKSPLLNPWFIGAAVLFSLHYLLQMVGVGIPFADAYLDDLLCMPVILSLGLAVMRYFYQKPALSHSQIVFTLIYCSLLFEVLLPLYSPIYTGDFIDVGLYTIGAWFFAKVMNK
jgi:hypothetical protein